VQEQHSSDWQYLFIYFNLQLLQVNEDIVIKQTGRRKGLTLTGASYIRETIMTD